MATTTNYSWTTPDDTALVKDGAAAIRSLGTAIDTTVFNNASAAIAKTIVDAKGDIIAATAADTVSRLAVGTNGQVLKANSATATGLEWGSAASSKTFSLLNTGGTALTGATTITVSSISNIDEILVFIYRASGGSANAVMTLRLNTDTNSNYQYGFQRIWSDSAYSAGILEGISNDAASSIPVGRTGGDAAGNISGVFRISGCNSTGPKVFTMGTGADNAGNNNGLAYSGGGVYVGTSAISSISLITNGSNFDAGTIYVYGAA